jgi:Trp operon repressor
MRKVQDTAGKGAALCAHLNQFHVPAAILNQDRRRFQSWNQSFLDLVELAHDEIMTAEVDSIFSFFPARNEPVARMRIVAAVIRNPSSARKPRTIVGMEHPAIRGRTSLLLAHGRLLTSPAFEAGKRKGAHETSQQLKQRLGAAIQGNLQKLTPMPTHLLESAPVASRQRSEIQKMVTIMQKMQDFVRSDFDALFLAGSAEGVEGGIRLEDDRPDR